MDYDLATINQIRAVQVKVGQHQWRGLVWNIEHDREDFTLAEGVDESVKVFSENAVFVVDCKSIDAVEEDEVSHRCCGPENVKRAQQNGFEHDWTVNEMNVGVRNISASQNTRRDQIDELNVGNVHSDRFEGLDNFDCASVCADVDPTHLEHLHERYDGACSDHKGV